MVHLSNKEIGSVGYGMMGLTWRASPPSQEQAFEAMKAAYNKGSYFWNGGELYGSPDRNSLHLLNEYFTKYPEDADKVVISIKGGLKRGQMMPDGSKENIDRSIGECLKWLDGKKSLDLFECARVDKNVPIEDTIGYIAEYIKAGKLGGISLSEVSAPTIRRAHAVHPISAVEVEFSMFSLDILENGVASTCAELGIPIVAYSPLGRGFLGGQFKKYEDIPADSSLKIFPRYSAENFDQNIKLVQEVEKIAKSKGATPAQVAIGWIISHSGKPGLPTIIPIPGATTAARIEENVHPAQLSAEELAVIDDILKTFPTAGERYNAMGMAHVHA
ncbi:Aldo/keto reductase [Amniculicola lignicola CBS 123094]|uniref:Aldo/keto reductase n=1 Tax=Amniculicola lignicola CBS 123094 TaxID=1392246 RepID=A0A6A5VX08_9PLEO|nr:Aldo/keto reductase [Amniculicola lignicola CBS 123094]